MPESDLRFCPRCGGELSWRPLGEAQTYHPQCVACGFVLWQNPKPSVEALIIRGEASGIEVLLGRRSVEPRKGSWDLPGNFLNVGDNVRDALLRECLREMGVTVSVGDVLGAYDDDFFGTHIVSIVYVCRIVDGEPRAADLIDAVQWFPLDDPPALAFPAVEAAVAEAQRRFRA